MEKICNACLEYARAVGIPISETLAHRLIHMVRVGLVGITGLVVQSTVFEVLGIRLELLDASTAALLGGEVAVLLGFTLNNHFNFRGRSQTHVLRRLLIFHLVVSGSLFIQWLLVKLAEIHTPGTPMTLRIAFAIGVCIGFLFNYIGYHLFVWKRTA